jgi:hypothetical protein
MVQSMGVSIFHSGISTAVMVVDVDQLIASGPPRKYQNV